MALLWLVGIPLVASPILYGIGSGASGASGTLRWKILSILEGLWLLLVLLTWGAMR